MILKYYILSMEHLIA